MERVKAEQSGRAAAGARPTAHPTARRSPGPHSWPSPSGAAGGVCAPTPDTEPFPPLPAVGPKRRTNHLDLMLGLGGDQEVRIDIAAVEQVDAWADITIG